MASTFAVSSGSAWALGLPSLGDGQNLTTPQERKLGDRIIKELYRDPDYLDDAVLTEYVSQILASLMKASEERGELSDELKERYAWQILLGRDKQVNAFALPGGYFGVYLGLISIVSTRDELASVMAHELSHVTQRHIARLIEQQGKMTPLMIGSMILGALAASRSPDAAAALMMGGQAAVVQNQLNFSRDMEREADRIGFGLMKPAGYAQQGFVGMFDKLQQANRINDNGSWPYLRSHPLTTQRIADMHARIGKEDGAAEPPATLDHVMMVARARVLTKPGVEVLRQYIHETRDVGFADKSVNRRVSALYAAALSGVQLQDYAQARDAVGKLKPLVQGNAPAQRQTLLLAAEVEMAAGKPEEALRELSADAQKITADVGRPELLARTQVMLQLKRGAEMTGVLQTWVATHPQDSGAWLALSRVWNQQEQPLRAIRAEAEAQMGHYDYAAARDRFKAGQDLARKGGGDFYDASIIDTRLREVDSLLKEQASDRSFN
ncbi:M48 family metalloprotease [Diaphorobacter sp. HDW4A]|uniref:M48 family metalloprotease n=1 Tax=Diaphorobacter sp. HDW4A TaxID=2714924 RepID=UPI001F1035BB|nr:M48 family metalloprotease [Diaphorobacter sp. HDW4A]